MPAVYEVSANDTLKGIMYGVPICKFGTGETKIIVLVMFLLVLAAYSHTDKQVTT